MTSLVTSEKERNQRNDLVKVVRDMSEWKKQKTNKQTKQKQKQTNKQNNNNKKKTSHWNRLKVSPKRFVRWPVD